jgi:hypothetical protein
MFQRRNALGTSATGKTTPGDGNLQDQLHRETQVSKARATHSTFVRTIFIFLGGAWRSETSNPFPSGPRGHLFGIGNRPFWGQCGATSGIGEEQCFFPRGSLVPRNDCEIFDSAGSRSGRRARVSHPSQRTRRIGRPSWLQGKTGRKQ